MLVEKCTVEAFLFTNIRRKGPGGCRLRRVQTVSPIRFGGEYTLVIKLNGKFDNGVLQVALPEPKKSRPKRSEPEMVSRNCTCISYDTFGLPKQPDTNSLDNCRTRAGT